VGVDDLVKVGDPVKAGDPLCTIHANSERSLKEAEEILANAIVIGDAPRPPTKLVDEIIG
jgi:thymidine phosphorylase